MARAIPPYTAARQRVEFEDVRLPVHTGPWRGLGAGPNIWAMETMVDHLARLRGEDPLAFRRRIIAPQWPRLRRALDRVAALAGWGALQSTPERGYGMACGVYKEMSYAAVIAEVTRAGEQIEDNLRLRLLVHRVSVGANPTTFFRVLVAWHRGRSEKCP